MRTRRIPSALAPIADVKAVRCRAAANDATGPGCVKSRFDAMILRVNRQAEAMHVGLRGGD